MEDNGIVPRFGESEYDKAGLREHCGRFRASESVFLQPFRHCAQRLAPVRYGVLVLLGHFCESASRIRVGDEDGVVAETVRAAALFSDAALYCPLEEVALTVDDEGHDALEPGGTRLSRMLRKLIQQFVDIGIEIVAIPRLIDKINISGKIVTADAMSMQKNIIDRIRENGGDFLIELKANQPSLRYGVEDRIKECAPAYSYTEGPEFGHGRIETRTYRVFDGLDIIADKEKWGGNMTIIEYESETVRKKSGAHTSEKRLYVSSLPTSTPALGSLVRNHWSIESMHWALDFNLLQDRIKRKSPKAARNLDSIQRIVHSVFSIWKRLRKKRSDKKKGMAELMRYVSMSFTRLLRFLYQK